MIIGDMTVPQLEFYRTYCNFVGTEKVLFDLRASGHTLDECCEYLNMDLSSVKRLSLKVNNKMIKVTSVVNIEKWMKEQYS